MSKTRTSGTGPSPTPTRSTQRSLRIRGTGPPGTASPPSPSRSSSKRASLTAVQILRANRIEVARRLEHRRPVVLGTERVEAVNASINRSQIGHEIAKRAAFGKEWGLVYRVEGSEVFATLYSIGDVDVSKVAVSNGGGGHKNAAGFHVSLERWIADFVI